jgi:hypothetical protein
VICVISGPHGTHIPPLQTRAAEHVAPHTPQLLGSIIVSVQVKPQSVSPIGHSQTPAVHASSGGQTFPQVPQLFGSVERLVQSPAHSVSTVAHSVGGVDVDAASVLAGTLASTNGPSAGPPSLTSGTMPPPHAPTNTMSENATTLRMASVIASDSIAL